MENQKFKLWKLALSTIHADGVVSKEELSWFNQQIELLKNNKVLAFTDEQVEELRAVLSTPMTSFIEEFEELKNPADCSQLLHIVRVVSHVDHEFGPAEQALYKKLEDACLKNVDQNEVNLQLKVVEKKFAKDDEVQNEHSLFERAFHSISKLFS